MTDIEAIDSIERIEETSIPITIERIKKPRTDKQIEAFKVALIKRDEKRRERMEIKNTLTIEKDKVKNERIIKKAILLKKKELRDDLIEKLEQDDSIDDDIKELKNKIEKKKSIL